MIYYRKEQKQGFSVEHYKTIQLLIYIFLTGVKICLSPTPNEIPALSHENRLTY